MSVSCLCNGLAMSYCRTVSTWAAVTTPTWQQESQFPMGPFTHVVKEFSHFSAELPPHLFSDIFYQTTGFYIPELYVCGTMLLIRLSRNSLFRARRLFSFWNLLCPNNFIFDQYYIIYIISKNPWNNESWHRRRERRKEQQARIQRFKTYGKQAKQHHSAYEKLSAFKRVQMLLAKDAAEEERQKKSFIDNADILPVPAAMVEYFIFRTKICSLWSDSDVTINWIDKTMFHTPNLMLNIFIWTRDDIVVVPQARRTHRRGFGRPLDLLLLPLLWPTLQPPLPTRWRILYDESSAEYRLHWFWRREWQCTSYGRRLWTGDKFKPFTYKTRT